jgi:hypothetical protein
MKQPAAQQCQGKRDFGDFPAARDFARLCSRNTGARMQPYRCPYCRWWHIGEHIGPKNINRRPRPPTEAE